MPRWSKMRSFDEARTFSRKLKIKHIADWREYSKSDKRPEDIPGTPWVTYKDEWISFQDYFGPQYPKRAFNNRERYSLKLKSRWLPYKDARKWARKLGFTSSTQWLTKMPGKRPRNIPLQPNYVYKHHGWDGWDDWLGYRGIKKRYKKFLSFKDARKYVHTLEIISVASWKRYSNSDKRPDFIPSNPELTYEDEWISYVDWLGVSFEISKKHFRKKHWLPFEEARKWAVSLGLTTTMDWHTVKTHNRPEGVPSMPHRVYRDEWKGWRYWVGLDNKQSKRFIARKDNPRYEVVTVTDKNEHKRKVHKVRETA